MRKTIQAVTVLTLFAASCGGGGGGGGTKQQGTLLGTAGGTASLSGGPSLVFPAGALSTDTSITIADTGQLSDAGTPIYQLGPDGITFPKGQMVQATLPIPSSVTNPVVYTTQLGSTTAYDALPTTASGGNATAALAHFSRVYVGPGSGGIGSSAPTITTEPASQTVTAPATATFSVNATGNPTPAYQWYLGTTLIPGATSASYTTLATTLAMTETTYSCTAYNSAGTVDSTPAVLTVNTTTPTAPFFTTQPLDQHVTAPGAATFTVAAVGNPAPTFQWYVGVTPIPSATSASYTTPATTVDMTGNSYTVVATNSMGSVTSNAAALTVGPASSGMAGIYLGTLTLTGGSAKPMMAAVTPEGEFRFALNDKSDNTSGTVGNATIVGTGGNGTLYTYKYTTATANSLTLTNVVVVPGTSITGSYSYGTSSGTFELHPAADPKTGVVLYNNPTMTLPASGGTTNTPGQNTGWLSLAAKPTNYDWTAVAVDASGNIFMTVNNVSVTGSLTQISSGSNLYRMNFNLGTLGNYTGLGWYSGSSYSGPASGAGWPLDFGNGTGFFASVFYCVLSNTTNTQGLAAAVASFQ